MALIVAAAAHAQVPDLAPGGSRIQKLQRDQLREQFGAGHPAVLQLDAQLRREARAIANPETVTRDLKDLDEPALRQLVSRLMRRIAALETEVLTLKSRIVELEEAGGAATPGSGR